MIVKIRNNASSKPVLNTIFKSMYIPRAVARSENLGGHIVLGGDNVPPLVEIGLTDLPKSGGARAPPRPPRLRRA